MSKLFITVRFDRMKNLDLSLLFNNMVLGVSYLNTDIELIRKANERLKSHENLCAMLQKKPRKKPYTADIKKLYAENNQLLLAVKSHYQSLQYSKMLEDSRDLIILKHFFKPIFISLKATRRFTKALELDLLLDSVQRSESFRQLLVDYGFMHYFDLLAESRKALIEMEEKQSAYMKQFPAPNTIQPAKDTLLNEMRLYMRTLEMYFSAFPEAGEEKFIRVMNVNLKDARKQLRNTTTRRIRRKEKSLLKAQDTTNSASIISPTTIS